MTKRLPNSSTLGDEAPGPALVNLAMSPYDVLGPLLAPTSGLRGYVDQWRYGAPEGHSPGVHPDVVSGAAHNSRPGDELAGESRWTSGDPYITSGAAEAEFSAKSARHREGRWPRGQVVVHNRAVRQGLGAGVILVD